MTQPIQKRSSFLLTAVLCVLLLMTLGLRAHAVELTDTDVMRQASVKAASSAGLLPESLDKQSASARITRQQLCAVAVRVYASVKNVDYNSLVNTAGERLEECPYIDTVDTDVRLAWLLGLIPDRSSGKKFRPNSYVPSQSMRAALYQAIATAGADVRLSRNQITELLNNSKDGSSVADWAREANAYYVYQGFMANDKNRLHPKRKATCEQLAESAFFAALAGHSAAMQSSQAQLDVLATHSGKGRVSWTNCNADSYRIYYYQKGDFSKKPKFVDLIPANEAAATMEATIPQTVANKPGKWFWSVDAFDSAGKLMASTDSTIPLTVTEETLLRSDEENIDVGEIQEIQGYQNTGNTGVVGITSGTYYTGYSSFYINPVSNSDIVDVARSQLGNVGGQPYWSWYGFSSRVAWCACFVSWCANQCGYIQSGAVPMFSYCQSGIEWFYQHGRWLSRGNIPQPGYIIFFDWGGDGHSDHVGIVQGVSGNTVYTIEGNASNTCAERRYSINAGSIMGYGVPSY